jgi:antitoxin component of MazEF toxin-antitoxin module
MATTVKLRKQTKSSKSLVVTLPQNYVEAHNLQEGDYVELEIELVQKNRKTGY